MKSRKIAIIADRSIIPSRGTTERIGARIGSVISWIRACTGLSGLKPVHDRMMRMKIAARRTPIRIWRKRASGAMVYPPNCFAFSYAASIASVNAA